MRIEQLRTMKARVDHSVEDLIRYLDSPAGRMLRRRVATGLIVSAPLVMRVPGLRRTPLGKAIELVGGATLVVKLAELIRDAELRPRTGTLG